MTPKEPIDGLATWPPPAAPPLPAALEAELATLAPVRPRRPARDLAVLIAVSLVYASGVLVAVAIRRDLGELPVGWIVLAGLVWLVGFVAPVYLALVPRPGTMMPRWRLAGALVVATSIGFVLLGLAIHPAGPSSLTYGWTRFERGHTCLEIGLATALVPVVLGALLLRRSLPVGSRWIGAALGAGGGALGGLVLHLHCRVTDGPHVGLVHGGVVIVAALLSAAIVPRVSDVR